MTFGTVMGLLGDRFEKNECRGITEAHRVAPAHRDIQAFLACDAMPNPWFRAYCHTKSADQKLTWFSALVPFALIPTLVINSGGWDIHIGDGGPEIWTSWAAECRSARVS
jgi:hypothetical protein